jgi:hypothetical protein
LFLENVAANILEFLEMTDAQKRKYESARGFYETLQRYKLKGGWKRYFERYTKNLRYDDEGVYSYGTKVIELDWIKLTAKRLGRWSPTTSRHQNYAIGDLATDWGFREIK